MVDEHGNVTFQEALASARHELHVSTSDHDSAATDSVTRQKGRYFFIRLFLTSGSVRGLFMRSLKFETESWIKAKRGSGNIRMERVDYNAISAAGSPRIWGRDPERRGEL